MLKQCGVCNKKSRSYSWLNIQASSDVFTLSCVRMERRSCQTDRLKQSSFGHCHVSLHTEMLQCVCVCQCTVCKNRCEVEHPSNALLTLLSFFLWLCLRPFVSLCSTTPDAKWKWHASTGRSPLMDVVLRVSVPSPRWSTDLRKPSALQSPFHFCLPL